MSDINVDSLRNFSLHSMMLVQAPNITDFQAVLLTEKSCCSANLLWSLSLMLKMIMLPTILSAAAVRLWNVYVTSSRDVTWHLPLPPGHFGIPFIGESFYMLFFRNLYLQRKRNAYGNIYVTHLFGNPTVRVCGAEYVRRILRGENTLVETQWPRSTRLLLGEGSLSHARGIDHTVKKKALLKAFSSDALSSYVPVIQQITRKFIQQWIVRGRVSVCEEMKTLNFELALRVLLGADLAAAEQRRLTHVFETFMWNLFCLPLDMPGSGLRKGRNARNKLLAVIDEIIKTRQTQAPVEDRNSVLGYIQAAERAGSYTHEEVKNLCLELLFAGHGTTSSAGCSLVYYLAKRCDVREKVLAELQAHGLLGVGCDHVTLQQLNQLPYVNNVVKEVLRISAPIPGGFRRALQTFEIGGYQVPKGWSVTYDIHSTHGISGCSCDPAAFNPDCWNQASTPEAYMPFGGGRRSCAGKDLARIMLKVFVVEHVRGCSVRLLNERTRFETFPMPYPTDGMPVNVTCI